MFFLVQLKNIVRKVLFSNLVENQKKLIIALDDLSIDEVSEITEYISDECSEYIDRIVFKVNDLLVDLRMEEVAKIVKNTKSTVFLDTKWYDIPNTMKNYFKRIETNNLGGVVEYVTVHASSARTALENIVAQKKESNVNTKILAVTILTSMPKTEALEVYEGDSIEEIVLNLARIALESGVDGIVCSPHEVGMLKEELGNLKDFEIITPGVRFEGTDSQDQTRVSTPKQAIKSGADAGVMGRGLGNTKEEIASNVKRYFKEIDKT